MRSIDRRRVEALVRALHARVIRPWLATPPHGPDQVFEILSAVAVLIAPLFGGTGFDPAAFDFFRRSLTDNLRSMSLAQVGIRHGPTVPPWLEAAEHRDRIIDAAEQLVGEIRLEGTHTSWKRLADALAAAVTTRAG